MRFVHKNLFKLTRLLCAGIRSLNMLGIVILVAILVSLTPLSVGAQPSSTPTGGDEDIDLLLRSSVIDVEIPLPNEPLQKLRFLARKELPDLGDPYSKFFTSDRLPEGNEKIISPVYGAGTHYMGPRIRVVKKEQERTGISFYLDLFPLGFEFVNNTVGVPVVVKEVKDGVQPEKFTYAFSKEEGIRLAKKLIAEYTPGVGTARGDFKYVEHAEFQKEKGRLFVYRVTKTYRGIPLLDEYIQVALDGEKKPANISYFWSKDIEPVEEDFQPISASRALLQAKRAALEEWDNRPPPLTLFNITLGYVNHRTNPKALVPAWVLECRWNEKVNIVNPEAQGVQKRYGQEVVTHTYVLAVDALIGQKVELVPPGLR